MDYSKLNGLIPAVIQDNATREVLMVGFMNQEALDRTIESGFATFFSRTRGTLWMKGETSGNKLKVERVLVDCDDDTLLVLVTRLGDGNVCHTGERTCFLQGVAAGPTEQVASGFSRTRQAMLPVECATLRNRRSMHGPDTQARHTQRVAAGRDDPAVRARRLQHLRERAIVLSGHRRSRDRLHADPRAGNGPVRRPTACWTPA